MDDEPEDTALRKWALQQAIAFRASFGTTVDADPRIAVAVARAFYQFLKGETK